MKLARSKKCFFFAYFRAIAFKKNNLVNFIRAPRARVKAKVFYSGTGFDVIIFKLQGEEFCPLLHDDAHADSASSGWIMLMLSWVHFLAAKLAPHSTDCVGYKYLACHEKSNLPFNLVACHTTAVLYNAPNSQVLLCRHSMALLRNRASTTMSTTPVLFQTTRAYDVMTQQKIVTWCLPSRAAAAAGAASV